MKKIILPLLCFITWSCGMNKSTNTQQSTDAANQAGADSAASQVTFTNPVLPGDYADPSVVRVGDDYWATATSSEWAPLFPILHSKNLVDWETVGHVFPEKPPGWADAHFWAPEISYDNGKYYIYYTANKKGGNLCVGVASATNPTGPYTDHGPLVCQEAGSIDGYQIRDEKGELYLIWKEDGNSVKKPTPMWGQRMNEERTALLGEKFELFRNDPNTWEGGLVEGAALMRRGEYFYMFYAGDACCGRGCTYGVGVARAKNLRGPWEKHSANPIMKQNDTWKCAGHGSLVTDAQGRDYFMYHAYSTKGTVYPGRQGLLDPVHWGADNWPYFNEGAPSVTAAAPHQENAPDVLDVEDEFNTKALAPSWQWSVTGAPRFTFQNESNGRLVLQASPQKIGSMLGQRTKVADYTATTALDAQALPKGTVASLTAIGDPDNAMGIGLSDGEILLWTTKGNKTNTVARTAAPKTGMVYFRLATQAGDKMLFSWSSDGKQWNPLQHNQTLDASYLPPWDRGIRVGLTAKGPASASATFDWFRLTHGS